MCRKRYNINMREETHDKLRELADEHGLSISWLIDTIVADALGIQDDRKRFLDVVMKHGAWRD